MLRFRSGRMTQKIVLTIYYSGSGVHISVNDKLVCSSMPKYEMVNKDLRVKEFSQCENVIPLEKGDKITLRAEYDVEKYPQ
jgi:hypothetical protein